MQEIKKNSTLKRGHQGQFIYIQKNIKLAAFINKYRLDNERECSMGYSVPSIDSRPSIYARDTISHRTRALIN